MHNKIVYAMQFAFDTNFDFTRNKIFHKFPVDEVSSYIILHWNYGAETSTL